MIDNLFILCRLREESNVGELKNKLRQQVERCQELEVELENLRELVDRYLYIILFIK